MRQFGIITWFDFTDAKRYGVIKSIDNQEYFLHHRNISISFGDIIEGNCYLFEPIKKADKPKASKIEKVMTFDHFKRTLSLLGSADQLSYQKRNQTIYINLITQSFIQYISSRESDVVWRELKQLTKDPRVLVNYVQFAKAIVTNQTITELPREEFYEYLSSFESHLSNDTKIQIWREENNELLGYDESYTPPNSVFFNSVSSLNNDDIQRLLLIKDKTFFDELIRRCSSRQYENPIDVYEGLLAQDVISIDIEHQRLMKDWLILKSKNTFKKKLEKVESDDHLLALIDSFGKMPSYFSSDEKKDIQDEVCNHAKNLLPKHLVFLLWVHNLINDYDKEHYVKLYKEVESVQTKTNVIARLEEIAHPDLVLYLEESYKLGLNQFLDFIYTYVKLNRVVSRASFKLNLKNSDFWSDHRGKYVVGELINVLKNRTTPRERCELFSDGYIEDLSYSDIESGMDLIPISAIGRVLGLDILNSRQKDEILKRSMNALMMSEQKGSTFNSDIKQIYEHADKVLTPEQLQDFEEKYTLRLPLDLHFELWKESTSYIFPESFIYKNITDFKESESSYAHILNIISDDSRVKEWLDKKLITLYKDIATDEDRHSSIVFIHKAMLICHICEEISIVDLGFYNYDLCELYHWLLNDTISDLPKGSILDYIHFLPVSLKKRCLKKVFATKSEGLLDLSLEQIYALFVKPDISLAHFDIPDKVEVDISIELALEALKRFEKDGHFLIMGDMFRLLYHGLGEHRKEKMCVIDLIEKCEGRSKYKFNWNTQGTIVLDTTSNVFRFIFDYDESLVSEIKKIPGRTYDPQSATWSVPFNQTSRRPVYHFMVSNRFKLDKQDNNHLSNNRHLARRERNYAIPMGRTYCDGRKGHDVDRIMNEPYWWCNNDQCFAACQTTHQSIDWTNYSILDFSKILNFNLDSTDSKGRTVHNGKYLKFLTYLNRFIQLQEKLYCTECDVMLVPDQVANYAFHTITTFKCGNKNCSVCTSNTKIYLNHCFNGHCNAIIDSRRSQKCSNGLYICENCGCCCSRSFYRHRLRNLQSNNTSSQAVEDAVSRNIGHLDSDSCYCFKDGKQMEKTESGFQCTCGNSYNIKRPKASELIN